MEKRKQIRIDYYHYRIRKGRVDILLQKVSDRDELGIPYHYVLENEVVCDYDIKQCQMEDDGDLVMLNLNLGDSHLHKNDKCWVPLTDIFNLAFSKEPERMIHHCLACFLDICPPEEELIRKKISSLLDDILTENAIDGYRSELQRVLDGAPIVILDAFVTAPDPQLLKEEIETLKHFRLYKPENIGSYLNLRYYSEGIDWRAFGSKIESIMGSHFLSEISDEL